ncbi:hypothetical protein [Kribbella steppae]|uniref:hypothetical protein n=1 Tax=Kribbella steppae TaxID=2512223 RepID=UPI00104EDCC1|nr:hypothetical protein [Kribbella steppae]
MRRRSEPGHTAAAQRIVGAHLVLNAKGQEALEPRLGKACAAAAAAAGGIPVLPLSSTDSDVEIIIVPDGQCVQARRLVISKDNGDVVADKEVVLPTPADVSPR